jgi:signal transduction histidine kinase
MTTFGEQGFTQRLRVETLVAAVLKLLRPALPPGVELSADLSDTESVMADPDQIHQVVMNLCTNACHAILSLSSSSVIFHPTAQFFLRFILHWE